MVERKKPPTAKIAEKGRKGREEMVVELSEANRLGTHPES